jgi:hypothetical protein
MWSVMLGLAWLGNYLSFKIAWLTFVPCFADT